EGYFGGCIIESGNQSIIVLTENRTLRKSIMKTLVHPYIEDMCIMQSAERAGSGAIGDIRPNADIKPVNESEIEPALVQEEEEHIPDNTATYETEPTEPETQPQETIPAETADGEHNIEFDFSEPGGEDGELPDDEPEEVIKPDDSDIFETEDRDVGRKEKGKGINATILIVFAFLLLVLLGLCFFLVFLPVINGVSTVEYFKRIFSTVSGVGSV
ncbi:MAG: hypothetical protein J5662_00560, partial [Clostridia bacterium]|nr:hypothetical protein [Clostridia bacterium]